MAEIYNNLLQYRLDDDWPVVRSQMTVLYVVMLLFFLPLLAARVFLLPTAKPDNVLQPANPQADKSSIVVTAHPSQRSNSTQSEKWVITTSKHFI